MKLKVCFIVALVALSVGAVYAQEQKKEMSADEKAMMAAWQKYMTPGEGHKALDVMAGTFDAKITTWMAPGAPPMISTGTSQNQWILGGRVLEQRFNGTFMDMPYSGIGTSGYDNAKKQYWTTWIDNMSTGIMISTGMTADGGRNWKFSGTSTDPSTGKDVVAETRITIPDRDHHTMEMWGPAPDGHTYKMMEIAYTRKK